ncbi:hypothetical protein Y032_0530g3007 [Ancylostoma ceylanicum]|uniref:Uncharacterized protein n=1 Tax=Ancylostoma ceylanicum TaxID=53326 RepID=A0A016WTY3_9BILA|nr:hypothetical protein Y032_0530g3007 [Ancylostoma ceylanicum]
MIPAYLREGHRYYIEVDNIGEHFIYKPIAVLLVIFLQEIKCIFRCYEFKMSENKTKTVVVEKMHIDRRVSSSPNKVIYTSQMHASIRERFSMKTGQRGMKISMERTHGRREAVNACASAATTMRLAPILHHIDARASVARIQYKLPPTGLIVLHDRARVTEENREVIESQPLAIYLRQPLYFLRNVGQSILDTCV